MTLRPSPMPAIRLTEPSAEFRRVVEACVRLGDGDSAPLVSDATWAWAQEWIVTARPDRAASRLRSAQLDALLLLLDAPFAAGETSRTAPLCSMRQHAIAAALIASKAKPRQLEHALRRLKLPLWSELAHAMTDLVAQSSPLERERRPWCAPNFAAALRSPASLVNGATAWLVAQPSAVQVIRLAIERLRADEAAQLPRDELLGSAALEAALARLTAAQWLARTPEDLARWIVLLPHSCQRKVLVHALTAIRSHGATGQELQTVDGLDAKTPSGAVHTWLRGILRIYGELDGWGVWSPQDVEPPGFWAELGTEGRRLVELLWLYDAIDEVLAVFRNEALRPERAEFWRMLRPWIRDARVLRRRTAICLLRLPQGAVIEFGEAGFAAYTYAFKSDQRDPAFLRLREARLPNDPRAFQSLTGLSLDGLELVGRGKLDHHPGWQQSWAYQATFSQVAGPDAVAAIRSVHGTSSWWKRWR